MVGFTCDSCAQEPAIAPPRPELRLEQTAKNNFWTPLRGFAPLTALFFPCFPCYFIFL